MSSLPPESPPRLNPPPVNPQRLHHRPLDRRRFLGLGGAAAVLLGTGAWSAGGAFAVSRRFANPFTLGVGSGDPTPDGVVLWTRLAPVPYAPDGHAGLPDRPVRVEFEVAEDEGFARVVRRSSVLAVPTLNHAVHPEVRGLRPARPYWYRFRVGEHLSATGRTRTAPAPGTEPASLRLAFASCQSWGDGHFTAYDHLAEEDLDLVVHLGDYLYEQGLAANKRGVRLPAVFDSEAYSLAQYRLRYSLYKSDPALQRAHAAFPWVQTIDDHEVENDWAGDVSQVDTERDQIRSVFRARRARAFRVMYENMPFRLAQLPSGSHVRLHRRLRWGTLADLTMLDTRQYRDDQPCAVSHSSACTERLDPNRTMLGGKQKKWLVDGFSSSTARWQLIGNQAPIGQTDWDPSPTQTHVWLDPWDGYVAERNQVLGEAQRRGERNLVVLTGDRHQNYAWDLKADYADPGSATVGTELVGTSITSGGDGADLTDQGRDFLAANPHLRFFNNQRGYGRLTVTPTECRNDFRVLPYVSRPGAPISTRVSAVVTDGRPGVQLD
ncbi:MAG: Alkaline phosphatase [Friedmanniella sp.]|nr:Alkaline phosphatase [Friedmanniella sp.]